MPARFLPLDVLRRYGRFAGEPDPLQLAGAFHLDDADLELIAAQSTPANRLGLALQLGCVRFLGTFVDVRAAVPRGVVAYVASQVGVDDVSVLADYGRGGTGTRHRALIRARDGYRVIRDPHVALSLARWLIERAWMADERPEVLFELGTARLRQGRVLLPGASTLERLVLAAQARMEARLLRRLAAIPTPDERDRLEHLLVTDGPGGTSSLDRLRRGPRRVSANGLVEAIGRLAAARDLAGEGWDLSGLPAAKVARLARHAQTARAQGVRRMADERRLGTLVAFAHTLRRSAQDDVVHLLDLYLRGLMNRVDRKDRHERLRTLRALDAAARDLADACAALLDDHVEDAAVRTAAFARVPATRLTAAVATVEALAGRTNSGGLERLAGSYTQLRRCLPGLLSHLQLDGNEAGRAVLAAWAFLRDIEGRRTPDMSMAPTEVVRGPWRRLVWGAGRTVNRPYYTWCVLDRLRDALRRRDVFVPGSLDWGDPRAQLLQGETWTAARPHICRSLELPEQADEALRQLGAALDEAYAGAESAVTQPDLVCLTSRRGRDAVTLARLERLDEPESLVALEARVAAALPVVDLSELLLEVNAWTGFAEALGQHPGHHPRAQDLTRSVSAVLLADACNIGLAAVADPTQRALSGDRLAWVRQNYVRAEAISEANARLVDAHAALPLAQHWGGGHVASADGLRFVVGVRSAGAAPNSRYFGTGRGLTYYNFVSDQHTGFHAMVVPGTLRDSLFVLDGLLEQRTRLEPEELMADTAASSDVVFALFWLLGYQFSPRLRDISDLRYWRLDRAAHYGRLDGLARNVIRPERIARHWEDILRIAGSLKLGTVRASDLMRTLQSGGRGSQLRQAIAELGRIVKTLYLLAYVSDSGYRRRILVQLNRGESRHAVARAVFFGRRGELRQPYRQGQEDQLGALGMVVNAIALWNTVYMGDVLAAMATTGATTDPADVARLSPLLHTHINLLGHYHFDLPADLTPGRRRTIRLLGHGTSVTEPR